MIDLVLAGLVLVAMAALAVVDARRMIVDPRIVLALVAAGLLWRLFGSADTESLWGAALGAGLGIAVVAAPIAVAHWCGRPWPLFPGDAMLLGGLGFVLGPLGLGWSLLAGSVCALLHRLWLQRRRGRAFRRGYCPLGPGMIAGAMGVFLFINAGGSLAAEDGAAWLPRDPALHNTPEAASRPLSTRPTEADLGTAMLAATELAAVRVPLPAGLGARKIVVEGAEGLSFAEATERIAALSGVPVEVEERPSRVAGGAVLLPDPPPVRLSFEGRLPDLLNLLAARAGYDWTWADGAIVFFRYRDVEQRRPEPFSAEGARAERMMDEGTRGADDPWIVERARHRTLRDILEDWAVRAGWSVVWKPARRYAVVANAAFPGSFLDAVDALLAAPATRRSLVALAHEPNRHLVIVEAEAVR